VGKHKIDIRFWREGEQTAFKVIKGDPELVERCKVESKFAELIPPPERLESSFWKVRGGNARADRFHLPRGVIRCAI